MFVARCQQVCRQVSPGLPPGVTRFAARCQQACCQCRGIMASKRTVEIYYDVISPFAWIGFEILCRYKNKWNIDVKLKPFFLGGVMRGADNKPPGMVPNKGMYMNKDLVRLSKYYQLPVNLISNPAETLFTKGSMTAMRFLTAVDMERPDMTEQLSRQFWLRIWSRDEDITGVSSISQAASEAGLSELDIKKYLGRIKDDQTKERLRQYTQEALDHGAFGTPTFLVEDENHQKQMVFGSDRMHIIAQILGEQYEGPLLEYAKL